MEIVRFSGSSYDEYEALLLRLEQVKKDAFAYHMAYLRRFGHLIEQEYTLQIDCIALKKAIFFCQSAINRGEMPDSEALEAYLAEEMAAYRTELDRMVEAQQIADSARLLTDEEVAEIREIYHRLVKLLHPDISPLTESFPLLADLFERAILAYRTNNLEELREIAETVDLFLAGHGIESVSAAVTDLKAKIEKMRAQIDEIVSTQPYNYKTLLENEALCVEKTRQLTESIGQYESYKATLETHLKTLLKEEGE